VVLNGIFKIFEGGFDGLSHCLCSNGDGRQKLIHFFYDRHGLMLGVGLADQIIEVADRQGRNESLDNL